MAVSFLTKRKSKIGSLSIEATLSEAHNMKATVTKFPVEGGIIVSDHIVNDPEQITLECFISNTPIEESGSGSAQNAFDELNKMWEAKELVDVVTQYKVYTDMAITDISVPRNNRTGQAIVFTCDLMKIRKVQSTAVEVYKETVAEATADQATTSVNTGTVAPKESNPIIQAITNYIMTTYNEST